MKISDAGLRFIMRWEGTILHVYKDQVGIPTVGVGHVVLPGEDFSGGITHQQAMELLRKDVAKCERALNDPGIVKVKLTQNQFDAMCSWLFNCGTGALTRSSTLTKLNAGDVQGAAEALLLWSKAGGKPNQGLLNRRKDEKRVFLTPDPTLEPVPTADPPTVTPEPSPKPTPAHPPSPEPQPVAPEPPPVVQPKKRWFTDLIELVKVIVATFIKRG